ncbi:diguanylate cyclase/phosphodiesterase (GGDEF & EAL domains) with PAS/PAC sensor(s) [hydrothermal vent metagenome]|uniref:Diguanylate cyclase/phosphodiesterase (GGDEF & EAL domains) with PAS/PAC sensor(S) n=1 Tax=hydrothermal vent metagenome TaxID=652676 RepID=A0A3B1AMA8_9ZZZZ
MKTERTLLLVDDEDNIRKALTRVLRRDGYTILQADSGKQGLAMLESNPETGVILSDQRMPGMTGIEFLSRARELRPDTVRMVLSGYTDLKTVTEAINQGEIYKFLTKPWEDELLRANLAEAFEHYELRFENERLARELQQINAELEQRVEQKTCEALVNMHALQISQEVLEHLPAAVLGIDEDGLLVMTNHQAEARLSHDGYSLVGQAADDVLPEALLEQIKYTLRGEVPAPIDIRLGSNTLHVHCGRMRQTSRAKGVIVVMMPKESR